MKRNKIENLFQRIGKKATYIKELLDQDKREEVCVCTDMFSGPTCEAARKIFYVVNVNSLAS